MRFHTIKHDAANIYVYKVIFWLEIYICNLFELKASNCIFFVFHFLIIACVFVQGSQTYLDSGFDDKTHHTSFLAMLEALAYTIDRIACEVITNHDYKILPYLYLHQHNNRN